MQSVQWFLGRFLHAPHRGAVEVLEDTLVGVDQGGRIDAVLSKQHPAREGLEREAKANGALMCAVGDQVFLPGLVDLHVHAPQWPQLGKALHLPLYTWLEECTFPLEARFGDVEYARGVFDSLVGTLMANGTTTAAYFCSVHPQAAMALADACLTHGQRAVVGKVVMDDPEQCPHYYKDADTQAGVEGTTDVIAFIQSMAGNGTNLVRPAITPRFIPSCTDAALQALGELAQSTGVHVQTHCSESDWEHQYVLKRLGKTDTTALRDFGLLTRRTILAHSNFINDQDMEHIAEAGAGVAHCPLSNAYFADSVFPLARALEKSVHVGLGTDIAGGPSASMFDAARHAIVSSRILDHGVDPALPSTSRGRPGSAVDFRNAFWLATAGGAEVLDLNIGLFEPGRQFDAMLVNTARAGSNLMTHNEDDAEDVLQKIVYAATRADIEAVWTDGCERLGAGGP
jgi:guanine deaminase